MESVESNQEVSVVVVVAAGEGGANRLLVLCARLSYRRRFWSPYRSPSLFLPAERRSRDADRVCFPTDPLQLWQRPGRQH